MCVYIKKSLFVIIYYTLILCGKINEWSKLNGRILFFLWLKINLRTSFFLTNINAYVWQFSFLSSLRIYFANLVILIDDVLLPCFSLNLFLALSKVLLLWARALSQHNFDLAWALLSFSLNSFVTFLNLKESQVLKKKRLRLRFNMKKKYD